MPNCDFYALDEDLPLVLDFVFSQPGWTLYELGSRNDSALRHFEATAAVLQAFDLANKDANFQLYAPEMGGKVYEERAVLKPNAVPGATFRYHSRGWGLIQFYLAAPRAGKLQACHTNHFSEVGARGHEPTFADKPDRVDDWDWKAVQRISSRLNRFIRGLARAKMGSRPVLPAAHDASSQGRIQLTL